MNKGKYIVIEGAEGVGKTTHIHELARKLRIAGQSVRVLREPDSQTDLTARAIRQITQDPSYPMNSRTEVLLYNAARSQSLQNIQESIDCGVTCIVDRNYLTTLAIQYYGRGDIPDYNTINSIIDFAVGGIKPDLCIVLDAPVNVLTKRLNSRNSGERFDNLDESFLERVRAGYLWEAKQRNFPVVYSSDNLEETANNIWKLVSENLSNKQASIANHETISTKHEPTSVADILATNKITVENNEITSDDKETFIDHTELTKRVDDKLVITSDGHEYLKQYLTDSTNNIYAFNDKISSTTIAAAMARLSRRSDDMRITILEEFTNKKDKDNELLERVITAYGDDSVQQLAGIHIVVENASNLLTKKLEWGRLASYLEQSTRYIYFDQKDEMEIINTIHQNLTKILNSNIREN
jgi:dTMP kinase